MHPHLLREKTNELSEPFDIMMNKSLESKTFGMDRKKMFRHSLREGTINSLPSIGQLV